MLLTGKTPTFAALLACMVIGANSAASIEIQEAKSGTLSKLVAGTTDATELIVRSGSLNASDFAFIADSMTSLRHIDISGCNITPFSDNTLRFSGVRSSGADTLPPYAFIGMTELKSVALPASLKAIGAGAFSGSGITSAELPDNVESIGDYAFMRCEALSEVIMPASLHQLGLQAFANCTALRSITFTGPTELTELPEKSFEGCTSLSEINLEELYNCTCIGSWALAHCSSVSTLTLPSGISNTGDGAMSFMPSLTEIDASELSSVPKLCDNVWAGINQSDVRLIVTDRLFDAFSTTPQWNNFNIISTTQVSLPAEPVSVADHDRLQVTLHDRILTVKTTIGSIGPVAIFNSEGSRVMLTQTAGNTSEINTAPLSTGVYLVVTGHGVAKIKI